MRGGGGTPQEISKVRNSISYDSLDHICVHSFSVSGKTKRKKVKPRTCVWRCIGEERGGGGS